MADLKCWCRRCEQAATPPMPPVTGDGAFKEWFLKHHAPRFIVCPDCGSKRCPKAAAHWLACTDSNEPGQAGSDYGPTPAGTKPPDTADTAPNE